MEINYVFRLKTAHEKLLDKIPDTDYSWMGLFKKGYKLQCLRFYGWKNLTNEFELKCAIDIGYKLRYKHSIQS